jgi:hypothetical protein
MAFLSLAMYVCRHAWQGVAHAHAEVCGEDQVA